MIVAGTILVIEDEPDQILFITHVLTGAGYRVVQAYGGDDAIRKVKRQKLDLVITDLAMPKVTGVEVITTIKSDPETAHLPILVVTAHVWDGIAKSARQAGCDGYISKPFTPTQLLEQVRKYIKSEGT